MVLGVAAAVGCVRGVGGRGRSPGDLTSGAQGWWVRWPGPCMTRRGRKVGKRRLDPQGHSHCLGFGSTYALQGRRGEGQLVDGGREEGVAKAPWAGPSL